MVSPLTRRAVCCWTRNTSKGGVNVHIFDIISGPKAKSLAFFPLVVLKLRKTYLLRYWWRVHGMVMWIKFLLGRVREFRRYHRRLEYGFFFRLVQNNWLLSFTPFYYNLCLIRSTLSKSRQLLYFSAFWLFVSWQQVKKQGKADK